MDYVAKLVCFGFEPCCARRIVHDYVDNGKEIDLAEYIAAKEETEGRL